MSIITQRSRDCVPCKVTSGAGLIGGGLYIAYHGRKFEGIGAKAMFTASFVLVGLGLARIFSLPPFHIPLNPEKRTVNVTE